MHPRAATRITRTPLLFGGVGAALMLLVAAGSAIAEDRETLTISPPGHDLREAKLKRRDLSGADLTGAVLHRAKLGNAKLDHAKLQDANLNKADLKCASLAGADLTGALLYGTDLTALSSKEPS